MELLNPKAAAKVQELDSFVRDEHAVMRQRYAEKSNRAIEERIEAGTCWAGLSFQRREENGTLVFAHSGNDSRLREGDLVKLGQREAEEGFLTNIFKEDDEQVWLNPAKGLSAEYLREKSEGWILDEGILDLEDFYLKALEQVANSAIGQDIIIPLLTGELDGCIDQEEYSAMYSELEEANTTKEQKWQDRQIEAIAACLTEERCYLVQGPPGTGKTKVLADVVARLVGQGKAVLLTSFTHRAIDHALAACARQISDRERVVRISAPVFGRDEPFDCYQKFSETPCKTLPPSEGYVVGATPFALVHRVKNVEFDVIVFDEASQITVPLAIMAMLRGRKYLFFGDQQQLGPVVQHLSRRETKEFGIFWTLKKEERAGRGTMLNVTFRLCPKLAHWPSESFYHGELVAPMNHQLCLAPSESDDWLKAVLNPKQPLTWIEFDHEDGTNRSEDEAQATASLLLALRDSGILPESMAVVTPYRKQGRLVRRKLKGHTMQGCVIDTVERMQGQEREVIVVTLSASEGSFIARQANFIFDPRRMNVSVTRAKAKLIILASRALLNYWSDDSDLGEEIRLFRSLRDEAAVYPWKG